MIMLWLIGVSIHLLSGRLQVNSLIAVLSATSKLHDDWEVPECQFQT